MQEIINWWFTDYKQIFYFSSAILNDWDALKIINFNRRKVINSFVNIIEFKNLLNTELLLVISN